MPPHRLSEDAKGVYTISATPFLDDGAIDFASADRLVELYIEAGVSGITILGMMGEANKLAPIEAEGFLSHVLARVAERVPVWWSGSPAPGSTTSPGSRQWRWSRAPPG